VVPEWDRPPIIKSSRNIGGSPPLDQDQPALTLREWAEKHPFCFSPSASHRLREPTMNKLRSGFMRRSCLAALALGILHSISATADAAASCGRPGLTLSGVHEKTIHICRAVDEVLEYFVKGGVAAELRLTIRFQRAVHVEVRNEFTKSVEPLPVSGLFRADRNEIQIVRAESSWSRRRRPWGLAWDPQIADSILQHEIAHAVINHLLGNKRERMPRAWHEALAYGVQLDLMDEGFRTKVLNQYPHQEAFADLLEINDFVYGFDPDAFSIAAYKTYVQEGKLNFLKKAVAFELEMINLNELLP
jgi:hypothetical protein